VVKYGVRVKVSTLKSYLLGRKKGLCAQSVAIKEKESNFLIERSLCKKPPRRGVRCGAGVHLKKGAVIKGKWYVPEGFSTVGRPERKGDSGLGGGGAKPAVGGAFGGSMIIKNFLRRSN